LTLEQTHPDDPAAFPTAPPPPAVDDAVPSLHPELRILPFEDSAATEEQFLIEVGEGHYVVSRQVRDLLVALEEEPPDLASLGAAFERISGLEVDEETLSQLLHGGALPSAFFSGGTVPRLGNPFLLNFQLLRRELVEPMATALAALFNWPLAILTVVGFFAVEVLAFQSSVEAMETSLSWGRLGILVLLVIFSGLFHELGHVAACRKFGVSHGGIGFGLYLIFPAFYADVTRAWGLSQRQRAVVDAGGLYFQALFVCLAGLAAWATGDLLWLQLVWIVTFLMAFTINPVFKLDGYWLLVDLSGLRNLHQRMVDVLAYPYRRLRGLPAPLPTLTRRRWAVMVLYILFSFAFYVLAFFLVFIILHGTYMGLPQVMGQAEQAASAAWSEGQTWEATKALGPVVRQLLWPVLVLFLLARGAWRLLVWTFNRKSQATS